MVQNTSTRDDWWAGAACALRRRLMLMKGASRRPAPTLPTNCLRLGLRMTPLLILNPGGEVRRVEDRHQHALQRKAFGLRLLIDRVVGAAILTPGARSVDRKSVV